MPIAAPVIEFEEVNSFKETGTDSSNDAEKEVKLNIVEKGLNKKTKENKIKKTKMNFSLV